MKKLSPEREAEMKRSAEVAVDLFKILHDIKDHGVEAGIEKFKKEKKDQDLDEEDF